MNREDETSGRLRLLHHHQHGEQQGCRGAGSHRNSSSPHFLCLCSVALRVKPIFARSCCRFDEGEERPRCCREESLVSPPGQPSSACSFFSTSSFTKRTLAGAATLVQERTWGEATLELSLCRRRAVLLPAALLLPAPCRGAKALAGSQNSTPLPLLRPGRGEALRGILRGTAASLTCSTTCPRGHRRRNSAVRPRRRRRHPQHHHEGRSEHRQPCDLAAAAAAAAAAPPSSFAMRRCSHRRSSGSWHRASSCRTAKRQRRARQMVMTITMRTTTAAAARRHVSMPSPATRRRPLACAPSFAGCVNWIGWRRGSVLRRWPRRSSRGQQRSGKPSWQRPQRPPPWPRRRRPAPRCACGWKWP